MRKKLLSKLALVTLGLGLFGAGGMITNSNTVTVSAKSKISKSQAKGKEIVKNWKPGHMSSFNPEVYKVPAQKGYHFYKGFQDKSYYKRAISESKKIGHIKSGSVKPLDMMMYDNEAAKATLTNGHKIVWNIGYYKRAVELIPGIISENQVPKLTNHNHHWVNYWVDDYAYDNENVSFEDGENTIFGNHYKNPAGYHQLTHGGHFPVCINATTNIYNSSKKILVSSAQTYMDNLKEHVFGITSY
ncbi:hypothetical protein HC026_11190 [Lactobacillus sp. LC28-10]|uniref:Uncharacterized protein n=1 Tax=Secundilactobacillus angelensis TaxID=2722706 RepID=A0ABX1KZT9_9LACO|nr:hypothetical protein [Secundilactobacillus angelensis]MCH5463184.1 hypothetical protein [Secundilactobacillus angelensis]NLR19457.1 hypothetical protein [Secundilactobacillus angelensis]